VHHDGAPTPQPVVVCRFYKAWTFSVSEGKTAKKVASYSMQAIANYLNYHQLVQNLASLDFSELIILTYSQTLWTNKKLFCSNE